MFKTIIKAKVLQKTTEAEKVKTIKESLSEVGEQSTPRSEMIMIMWVVLFFAMIILLGFWVSLVLFPVIFLHYFGRENWKTITVFTAGLFAFVYAIFALFMNESLYGGVLGYAIEYFSG